MIHSRKFLLVLLLLTTSAVAAILVLMPESNRESAGDLKPIKLSGDVTEQIQTLTRLLEEERERRFRLEKTLALTNQNLSRMEKMLASRDIAAETPDSEQASDTVANASVFGSGSDPASETRRVLASLGVAEQRIARIESKSAELEMQQLFLRDRAVREGWFGTDKYFAERRKISASDNPYRAELGDRDYDRYLYESGQANRIVVQNVIAGSPAQITGLLEGDIVYSYDEQRVFSWSELTSLTSKGDPDIPVRIQILRDNNLTDYYIPRGPLGIRLDVTRMEPD